MDAEGSPCDQIGHGTSAPGGLCRDREFLVAPGDGGGSDPFANTRTPRVPASCRPLCAPRTSSRPSRGSERVARSVSVWRVRSGKLHEIFWRPLHLNPAERIRAPSRPGGIAVPSLRRLFAAQTQMHPECVKSVRVLHRSVSCLSLGAVPE